MNAHRPESANEQPWVLIYRSSNPGLVAVAKSVLEGARIAFVTRDEGSHGAFPGAPFVGRARIFAPPERADEARELLSELNESSSGADGGFFEDTPTEIDP